jgi:hypothetical protein
VSDDPNDDAERALEEDIHRYPERYPLSWGGLMDDDKFAAQKAAADAGHMINPLEQDLGDRFEDDGTVGRAYDAHVRRQLRGERSAPFGHPLDEPF